MRIKDNITFKNKQVTVYVICFIYLMINFYMKNTYVIDTKSTYYF